MKLIKRGTNHKFLKALAVGACLFTLGAPVAMSAYQVHAATAYDISEFQGYLTPYEVKRLKSEVSFLVLRVQYGGLYQDKVFAHNVKLLQKYHVPYGVYSYSLYANVAQAKAEANALHVRAPKAKFYANDLEEDHAYNLNAATSAWADQIHKVSDRPAILYSGEYFMNTHITQATRNKYNAIWLAAYGAEPDTPYHYDLWQFSSDYYSRALGQSLDADTFPDGNNKTLQFWIGNSTQHGPSKTKRSTIKPMNTDTAKATTAAKQAAIVKRTAGKKAPKQKQVNQDENKAKDLANNASDQSQEVQQLQNENKLQSEAMQKDTDQVNSDNKVISSLKNKLAKAEKYIKTLATEKGLIPKKTSKYAKNSKAPKGKVVPGYYTSKRIHYVRVINPTGISIYDHNDDNKLAHARKNEVIHVLYFKPTHFHGKLITRAVGDYGWNSDGSARQVVFTSNKHFVHMYD